jgi:hypothetical protein
MKKDKMIDEFDRKSSLENLENDYWVKTNFEVGLIEKCYHYRKIPIQDLSIEQVRLLIGQSIGLDFLLPIAIEFLEKNLLSEGDFYEGDLLESILKIKNDYWKNKRGFHKKIVGLIENGKAIFDDSDEGNCLNKILKNRFEEFKKSAF